MDISITYRNISYVPKGDAQSLVELPGEVTLQARSGQGTYEPLAVHLNEHGIEFSGIWYDHAFLDIQPDLWHARMARPAPHVNPPPPAHKIATATTVAAMIMICLALSIVYGALAWNALHPTYVTKISCANDTRIVVRTRDRTIHDRIQPPSDCTVQRSKH